MSTTPKFKKGDTAYHFNGIMPSSITGLHSMNLLMVCAWIIRITEVKGSKIIGYTMRTFAELKHHNVNYIQAISIKPLTEKKIKSMKDTDLIFVRFDSPVHDLLTHEELKMQMIKWIANDFNDPTDIGEQE